MKPAATGPVAAKPATPRYASPGGMRILVVENHDDTRYLLGLLLEQLGHSVHAVATIGEAVASAGAERFDVLISDIGLPDGSGWELMPRLKEHAPPFAIAMSGFGMSSDRQKSLAAGFHHHLVKPVEPNQLENLLEEASARVRADARG